MNRYDKRCYTIDIIVLHTIQDDKKATQMSIANLHDISTKTVQRAVLNLKEWNMLPDNFVLPKSQQLDIFVSRKTKPVPSIEATPHAHARIIYSIIKEYNINNNTKLKKSKTTSAEVVDGVSMSESFENLENSAIEPKKLRSIRKKKEIIFPEGKFIVHGKEAAYRAFSHLGTDEEYFEKKRKSKSSFSKAQDSIRENYDLVKVELASDKLPSEISIRKAERIITCRPSYFVQYYTELYEDSYGLQAGVFEAELFVRDGKRRNARIREISKRLELLGGMDMVKHIFDFYANCSNWREVIDSGKIRTEAKQYPVLGVLLHSAHQKGLVEFMQASERGPLTDDNLFL